ncbi:MAG: transcription-repair coupling factor [Nannocystaceae bacterium]
MHYGRAPVSAATPSPSIASLDPILAALRGEGGRLRVLGAQGGFRGLLLARAALDPRAQGPLLAITPSDAGARALAADAGFFLGLAGGDEGSIVVLPDLETSPYGDQAADPRVLAQRLGALYRILAAGNPALDRGAGRPRLILASVAALLRKVMPRGAFAGLCAVWEKDATVELQGAQALLVRAGYQRVDVVEDPGTFAVRGGVVDVYPALTRFPVRMELFGDEIERLRLFDPDSQRSLREVDRVVIHPVREAVVTTERPLRQAVLALADRLEVPTSRTRQVLDNLEQGLDFFGEEALTPLFHGGLEGAFDYLPAGARIYVDDPEGALAAARSQEDAIAEQHARAREQKALCAPPEAFFLDADEFARRLGEAPVLGGGLEIHEAGGAAPERRTLTLDLGGHRELRAKIEAARAEKGAEILRPVVDAITALQGPWSVVLVAPNQGHVERLSALLRAYGVPLAPIQGGPVDPLTPPAAGADGRVPVRVLAGSLGAGFVAPADRLFVVAEAEIYGTVVRRDARARRSVGVQSLTQLAVGDFVVHVNHGVGRYLGLVQLTLREIPGDFVQVEYAGGDKLYLPVYRLGEIERFVAGDAKPPRLDKMGGTTFLVKVGKVKQEVRQLAEELLQIYAQREANDRDAYPDHSDLYLQFEATFPFEETPDQAEAITAVQKDLSKRRPMDRLVCGDVGFGKTEVALRAAFRAAIAGKQVAVLAPTTVLVQQHLQTFQERMEHFPLKIAALSRFMPAIQEKRVIAAIHSGAVDVVVGTHRLLSKDVRFKDLGLVVIDEEQRFGVAQKERFKKLRTHVDVLTLTATPIPRTLHLSLLGLREISLITTPPVDRLAVRTHVTRAGDAVIEEGVRRELARGGQVFYVVPRIQGIEEHAQRIRDLVPEARVLVAHGQMHGDLLERAMIAFVEHQADVLVSTTIIESGLDIPRANTMFIAQADQFGLAQLYQLRGRVGRSRLRAYCYLMVHALERLAPDARKRLEAIQRHAELGSGFNIASHDLEIRGAGELLGGRQSGQIQAIGFDAYARVLAEAVAELRGAPIAHESDPELAFDLPAFLPEAYIADVGQRLDFYRRLSLAPSDDVIGDVMAELADRYGEPPLEAEHLALMMTCKHHGVRLGALSLELAQSRFAVRLGPRTPVGADLAASLGRRTDGRLKLASGDRIVAAVRTPTGPDRRAQLHDCVRALIELRELADPGSGARGRGRRGGRGRACRRQQVAGTCPWGQVCGAPVGGLPRGRGP